MQAEFFINLGIDGGEKGIREYKTNKFPNNTIIPLYNVKLSHKETKVQNEVISKAIKSATEYTPIEKYNNIHFKRDDLYKPYSGEFSELGGSKLRQMQMLLQSFMKEGKFAYNGIITYSQTTSIQTLIVAKIAQEYGIKCTIGIGVKSEKLQQSILNNKLLTISQSLGADIVSLSNIGYNSALKHKAIN